MHFLWLQLSRFWYWVQQGGNSNIVLIGVTAWYVLLTRRIMKATARQAAAMLQPVLTINGFIKSDEPNAKYIYVENAGSQPVVLIDLQISCYPHGRKPMTKSGVIFADYVLSATKQIELPYGFAKELNAIHVSEDMCGYQISIVVADLSRQVVAHYQYYPVMGHLTCTLGMPSSTQWRVLVRQWKWKYYGLRSFFKKPKP